MKEPIKNDLVDDLIVPQDIRDAERKVSEWMKENGYNIWVLQDSCSRNFASEVRRFQMCQ